jgi:putative membrane protein
MPFHCDPHQALMPVSGHTLNRMPQLVLTTLFITLFGIYAACVRRSRNMHKRWPVARTICWNVGVLCALAGATGPLAERAHANFSAHMLGHLLLGMLAPLLMACAAPMTVLLRALHVSSVRQLSRFLRRNRVIGLYSDPAVAALLNIGGLWLLYGTDLYLFMQHNELVHLLVHIHVFLAGYLFTASIVYTDPVSRRRSYLYRAVVLVAAMAGHSILAKRLYAFPPAGVPANEEESGALLMYFGGDLIDLVLIILFCREWLVLGKLRLLAAPWKGKRIDSSKYTK